jgi:hypothetical protein
MRPMKEFTGPRCPDAVKVPRGSAHKAGVSWHVPRSATEAVSRPAGIGFLPAGSWRAFLVCTVCSNRCIAALGPPKMNPEKRVTRKFASPSSQPPIPANTASCSGRLSQICVASRVDALTINAAHFQTPIALRQSPASYLPNSVSTHNPFDRPRNRVYTKKQWRFFRSGHR